jgi:hypothetical protein
MPDNVEMAKQEHVMRNVRVGDLAIIVDDGGEKENLGLIVKVLKFEGLISWSECGIRPTWQVKVTGARLIWYERCNGELYQVSRGMWPDCCLRRIAPDQKKNNLLKHEQKIKDIVCEQTAVCPSTQDLEPAV